MSKRSRELSAALDSPQLSSTLGPDIAIQDYASYLDLPSDPQEMSAQLGGLVLDIGSGYEYFGYALSAQTSTTVVSVNPKLLEAAFRADIHERWNDGLAAHAARLSVAALVQGLPFKDNTFDSVVSLYALPTLFDERSKGEQAVEPSEYERSYSEVVRVLKPGGRAFLAPIWDEVISWQALRNIPGIACEFSEPPLGTLSSLYITKTA